MKTLLATLLVNGIASVSFATSAQHDETLNSLVQTVCKYNQDVLLPQNRYGACFDKMDECLSSPLWSYRENVTSYMVTGGFGYSCHFMVDKASNQVTQFKLTDPGE